LALLQLAVHLRTNQQCARYALHSVFQFLFQPRYLLPVLCPALLQQFYFCAQFADAPCVLVFQAHLVEDEEDCEATLYTFRLEKVLWAVLGAYFFWMRQKEGKSMAL
jgi:hypothetical protein